MTARGDQYSAGLPVLSKQKKPGDHEYDLSSVPDGKSLLSSMYVLSLAIYNLTACSHTVWGDQTQGNQHGPDVPVLSPGDQHGPDVPVLSPGDHEHEKERVSMFTLHAVRLYRARLSTYILSSRDLPSRTEER